eukprot:UN18934
MFTNVLHLCMHYIEQPGIVP